MSTPIRIGVVGGGPRALSLLERLCAGASLGSGRRLEVHIWEPSEVGPGRIWDPDQDPLLVMNTRAAAVTIFPDDTVDTRIPAPPGPSLYDMVKLAAGSLDEAPRVHGHRATVPDLPAALHEECLRLGPYDYPSRALYGHYLRWIYRHLLRTAPVHVHHHRQRAHAILPAAGDEGRWEIRSGGGEVWTCDDVVLALGWTSGESVGQSPRWIGPDNPIDQNLEPIAPGEQVLLRGLGMSMFDNLVRLTQGRGGRFRQEATGELCYLPSGNEPRILIGSRSGGTYWAKPQLSQAPRPPVRQHLKERIREAYLLDFGQDLWPAVLADAAQDFYSTLFTNRPEEFSAPQEEIAVRTHAIATSAGPEAGCADLSSCEAALAFDNLARRLLYHPVRGLTLDDLLGQRSRLVPAPDPTSQLAALLDHQILEARQGDASSLLRSFTSFTAAKVTLARLAEENRITAVSRGSSYAAYRRLTARLSGGPPLFRVEQLRALIDCGIVSALGPGLDVQWVGEKQRFLCHSTGAEPVQADWLIESWLHSPGLAHTSDPLLKQLLADGYATTFRHEDQTGTFTSDALHLQLPQGQLVGDSGSTVPGLYSLGIPSEQQLGHTIISPVPGTGAAFLRHTDATASSLSANR